MIKVTAEIFENLSLKEKVELLCKRGVFLSHIVDGRSSCSLYYLYGFYVENIYDHGNKSHVIKIEESELRFDRYLEYIDLSELLLQEK